MSSVLSTPKRRRDMVVLRKRAAYSLCNGAGFKAREVQRLLGFRSVSSIYKILHGPYQERDDSQLQLL